MKINLNPAIPREHNFDMLSCYSAQIKRLKENNLYRNLPFNNLVNANNLNSSFIDFSSNDYLNFSTNEDIIKAAYESAKEYGVGSTGSRLLSGDNMLYQQFEKEIASDKNMESALIFNSGFQANSGILAALCDPKVLGSSPLVFFDRLNHASLYQGLAINGISPIRFQHNDMAHLEKLCINYKDDTRAKFIVCESLYGMDGDFAPLQKIVSLAREYNAFLYIDEAHATGLYGKNGYGLSTDLDLTTLNCAIMGTFSKALGASGAYLACNSLIKEYIVNKCQSFIYSTALSPMIIGAARQSWRKLKNMEDARKELLSKANYLRKELQKKSYNIGFSTSHIVIVIIGDEAKTIAMKEHFEKNNIRVAAIRPPTVPPASSRLKISLTLNHKEQDISQLIKLF